MATQTDDPDPILQEFLDVNGLTPDEVANRADLLEKLAEYHNLHLDGFGVEQYDRSPLITLSEKCDLCNFSSHTFCGINVQKGIKNKNQI